MNSIEIAREAASAAADRKAVRPVLLDLRGQSDICDYQFICSGESNRQAQAIAEAIHQRCKAKGILPNAVEGKQNGNWILMDYGDTLIHVFFNYLRDYYAIEELWPNAKFVALK